MKKLGFLFIMLALVFVVFQDLLMDQVSDIPEKEKNGVQLESESETVMTETAENKKEIQQESSENGLAYLIGKQEAELIARLGSPARVDPSAYGYNWWIYEEGESYIQAGVKDGKVVTLFGVGDVPISPFQIGDDYESVLESFPIEEKVSLTLGSNSYRFELTEEELRTRPLIELDGVWTQLYFDQYTQKLSSIRYLDLETLLIQRPYSLTYRGTLPDDIVLSKEQWADVEEGASKQILAHTNMIRIRHDLPILEWDADVAHVAYLHSKDMLENNYFAHTSPTYGELKDRLENKDISFQLAAENIAAQYVDAIAAVEGWLNSEGHRVNLLHEEFTHLGVGVYEKYYTQNFLTPWNLPN